MRAGPDSLRLVAATVALGTLSACAASTEVRQAVAQRHAAEAGAAANVRPLPEPVAQPQPGGTSIFVTPGTQAGAASGATNPAGAAAGVPAAAPAAKTAPVAGQQAAKPAAGKAPAAAAAACGAVAPPGGNGGAADTGVTATTIKIGGTFFNGGYLDKYGKVSENAPRAYFNYTNDSGGICGRKIQFVTCDTAGTADGTTGCLTKLADSDQVFIMGPSLDFNLDIVQPALAKRRLPWVGSSGLYAKEFTSPWMYPTQPPGTDVGGLITQYATTKLAAKKIGVSYLNDVAGPECTAEATRMATAHGAQVVKTASNREIETSLDSQVATLKNAGVDTVVFCNDPVNNVKFIQAAQRVGWKPQFVCGFVVADDVPKAAGSNGRGMYGFSFWDFYKSDAPGVKQYRQITEYYFPQTFHHFYEQASYAGAEAIVAALRAVGPHLTRDAFLKALRSMTDFDTQLGLHLNFANLGAATTSGIMLKADDSLVWQVVSTRFFLAGRGGAAAVAPYAAPAVYQGASRRMSGRRRA